MHNFLGLVLVSSCGYALVVHIQIATFCLKFIFLNNNIRYKVDTSILKVGQNFTLHEV